MKILKHMAWFSPTVNAKENEIYHYIISIYINTILSAKTFGKLIACFYRIYTLNFHHNLLAHPINQLAIMIYSDQHLLQIISSWGISPLRIRQDIPISGSPERCLYRVVAEDRNCDLFLLENIGWNHLARKTQIIETVKRLHANGLNFITPYMTTAGNTEIVNRNDTLWQLCPFITGEELKRPGYVFDGWRGERLAEIMVELAGTTREITMPQPEIFFSIKTYIYNLMKKLSVHAPKIQKRIHPVVEFLEKEFMKIHSDLPTGFCHGDFHPLNIIWSKSGIKAVIDWEFSGYKPEIYDLALLLGCLGMEDPACLTEDLVRRLLKRIKKENIFTPVSMAFLLEFVIAVRFAWLSEWLIKNDADMIELEFDYLELLVENSKYLKQAWKKMA